MYRDVGPSARGRPKKRSSYWASQCLSPKSVDYIREFGNYTTLHGVKHFILPNYHYIETLLWAVALTAATTGAAVIIWNNWTRYIDNPTVIALEKDFRQWNLTFPAATVCFLQGLNYTIAPDYILQEWGIVENTSSYNYYLGFLENVANLSYYNLTNFKNYVEDKDLEQRDMGEIARKVMINMEYHATVFNPAYKNIAFHETLTEMGICHTYSGVVPNYITLKENPVTKNLIIPKCNYLNSLCYARIEDLPTIIKYYVHSPYEIPDSSDKYFVVMLNMEKDTAFRFQETVASPYLRRLQPKQRRCRFVDEPTFGPVYSYNLCRMQCRKKLAHQLCGCAPYFYMAEPSIPVCGVKGLKCLSEYSDYLIRLQKKDGNKVNCNCMFQCEATIYYIDRNTERRWTYPVPCNIRFRWAIEHYSKTRHKRDIIFGFEDLLVSLGGTAAFFLGCSVITFVEIAYFFTIRLCFYLIKN